MLQTASFLLSAVWGLFVYCLSWLGWHSKESGPGAAIAMGVLAAVVAWAVTSFFAGVLLSVVDAVYLCYAMDRDTQVSSIVATEAVARRCLAHLYDQCLSCSCMRASFACAAELRLASHACKLDLPHRQLS